MSTVQQQNRQIYIHEELTGRDADAYLCVHMYASVVSMLSAGIRISHAYISSFTHLC